MGRNAWLREALASRRGPIAAAAGAAALFLTAHPAAGVPRPAWSKAWAEHELRKHYDAVSAVCLPLGPATREKRSDAFKEFVCVVVTRDGTRYTIRLRPRSKHAWTTLGIDRRPAAPAGAPEKGHPRGHSPRQPE
jgi:hypothetical protein